jgi:hypothetical protein
MTRVQIAIVAALAACASVARADTPPGAGSGSDSTADADPAKREARALLREGVRLLGTGDNAGALALFRSAYAKFPSAKILLNIGSTLKTMGRTAEAANTYQAFLDAPDTDPSKTQEVEALLAQLDGALGRLAITVDVPDAAVQIGDTEWLPAATAKLVRVAPGGYEVHGRKAGLRNATAKGEVAAGAIETIALTLTPAHVDAPVEKPPPEPIAKQTEPQASIGAHTEPSTPSSFGAVAAVVVDGKGRGAAGMIGAGFDVNDRVTVEAGALLGPTIGGYAGGVAYVTGGNLRPLIAAGIPVFFSSGARVGVRAAGGLEWRATAHVGITAELAIEHYFNPEADIDATAFVPLLGVRGRL